MVCGMRIRHVASLIIIAFFCIIVMTGQTYAEEIDGYPIIKEDADELAAFLKYHQWEVLPVSTEKIGLIDSFATADQNLCAIQLDDKLFVISGEDTIACYYYHTEGTSKLLFQDGCLVVYEVRGSKLLFIDCVTGELSLYSIDVKAADLRLQAEFYKFGEIHSNKTVDGDGYYVTNHLSWTNQIFNSYEKLVLKQNGQEIVLYETHMHIVFFLCVCISTVIVAIVLFLHFCRRKNKG